MAKYALLQNETVVELVTSEVPIETMYHPSVAAFFVEVGGEVDIGWTYDNGEFCAPESLSIDMLKQTKIEELTARCSQIIVDGYSSDALGKVHTYPSKLTDQINMMGSVTDSLLPTSGSGWSTPFWCMDENHLWSFRDHSAAQIQKAGTDGKAHVIQCQTTLDRLVELVNNATTEEGIVACEWPST